MLLEYILYSIVGIYQDKDISCTVTIAENKDKLSVCMIDNVCDPDCEEPKGNKYWIFVAFCVILCILLIISITHLCIAVDVLDTYNTKISRLISEQILRTDDWKNDPRCRAERASVISQYSYWLIYLYPENVCEDRLTYPPNYV